MDFLRGKASNEKKVKSYSWMYIILALIDVIITAFNFAIGTFSSENLMKASSELTMDMVNAAIIFILVIVGIKVLSLIFLGIKGLKELKKEKQGMGYLVFAKVVFIVYVITTILGIIGVIRGTSDLTSTLLSAFVVVTLYDFTESTKELSTKKK